MPKRLSQLYQEELQRVTGSSSNYRSDLRTARYGDGRKSTETNALNAISTNQQNKDLDTYAEYEAASGLTEKYALSEGKRHLYEQGFYSVLDKFITAVVAGSVNGTSAEPVGATRTVTDTNSKISITGSALSLATGGAVNSGIWYSSQARKAGRIFIGQINTTGVSNMSIGWSVAQTTAAVESFRFFSGTTIQSVRDATNTNVGLYTINTNYQCAFVMRSSGVYSFIKGGTEYPNWTMLYSDSNRNGSLFPGVWMQSNTTVVFTATNLKIPNAIWLPTPTVYDTFTRADGVLGNTETSGPESQKTPSLVWTSTLGTWAIATNVAAASATSGGSAFATVNTPSADILIDANLTRAAGVCGVVLRYANSTNYIIAYHDGTNVKLDKVIAGSTTNILTAVQAYSAGATLRVVAYGSSFRLFYNNVAIGAVGTIADAAVQTTTVHGLYTTDTGATFDNFLIFPRGTSNEYSPLDFL